MQQIAVENTFESWRVAARQLIAHNIPPQDVIWTSGQQTSLFAPDMTGKRPAGSVVVPSDLIKLAKAVSCFDDAGKWPLLYSILYRLLNENRHLLAIESDAEVRRARVMEKAVNRDVHKFHAFVRFRSAECEIGEFFVAWHEPQHWTVERATPFFARRFGEMRFSILTPKGCAHWDLERLTFTQPATRDMAPVGDETEDFWLLYYRSIFNPFRLNVKTMKRELPVSHWPTLPEARLIPELIEKAKSV